MITPYDQLITKEFKPNLQSLKDDLEQRKDKNFFQPTGTQVYVGRQGSGKTTAAVKHATIDLRDKYPLAILVSNLKLNEYTAIPVTNKQFIKTVLDSPKFDSTKYYFFFQTMAELELVLTEINNGFYGVIYLIDEIHTYFNALESKAVPSWVFTEISQQRKQRKLIIGTSQLFLRMAKPFREQCSSLIVCSTIFGFITRLRSFDGMTLVQDYDGSLTGTVKKSGWFFHTRRIRAAFDTFQKISQTGSIELEAISPPLQIKKDKKKIHIKSLT